MNTGQVDLGSDPIPTWIFTPFPAPCPAQARLGALSFSHCIRKAEGFLLAAAERTTPEGQ